MFVAVAWRPSVRELSADEPALRTTLVT